MGGGGGGQERVGGGRGGGVKWGVQLYPALTQNFIFVGYFGLIWQIWDSVFILNIQSNPTLTHNFIFMGHFRLI